MCVICIHIITCSHKKFSELMYFMLPDWWLSLNPSFYPPMEIFPSLIFHVSLLINRGHTDPGIASPAWLLLPKPALWGKKGWVKVHTHGSKGTTGRKYFSCCFIQLLIRGDLLSHPWFYTSSTLSWSLYFMYLHMGSLVFCFIPILHHHIKG